MNKKDASDALLATLERAWDDGCSVAGSTDEARKKLAAIAARRISSFARRLGSGDFELQVRDLAKGLVARSEKEPALVGPLTEDYRWLARQLLKSGA